ncbi:MAG: 3'-5' exoribonuclease YhaM family protein [Desulfovibrionaceae bacterium]
MEKHVFVRDLQPGTQVSAPFMVAEARRGQARNGPYVKLVLQDRTGRVDGVIWSPLADTCPELGPGALAVFTGAVTSFKDQAQIRVDNVELLDRDAAGAGDYLPASERPAGLMLEELGDLVLEHIEYKPLRQLVRKVLDDEPVRARLLAAPGAKTVHHAYVGGLLEHTLAVARLCMSVCDLYPALDRQVLLAGAVLHDLGKAWELASEPACDYTDPGRLMGHVNLGLEVLAPYFAKARGLDEGVALHLKHLIVSHHGEFEFGAAVRPMTPEAFVLHFCDNMDSKLNQTMRVLDELEPDQGPWTPFQRFLDRPLFKAAPTPGKNGENGKNHPPENQCLLPLKG